MQRKGVLITILARALLICIQPGFSVSLGDLTAVFPGMMEEMEDGKNDTLCAYFILHASCQPCPMHTMCFSPRTGKVYPHRLQCKAIAVDAYKYMIQVLSFHLYLQICGNFNSAQ